jgi:hypothetical protein
VVVSVSALPFRHAIDAERATSVFCRLSNLFLHKHGSFEQKILHIPAPTTLISHPPSTIEPHNVGSFFTITLTVKQPIKLGFAG